MENRRIIFMGTPKIASVVLKTMLENDIHVERSGKRGMT